MQLFGSKTSFKMPSMRGKLGVQRNEPCIRVRLETRSCTNCGFATINMASGSCLSCGKVITPFHNRDNNKDYARIEKMSAMRQDVYYCTLCRRIFKNESRFRDHVWPCRIRTFLD